MNELTDSYVSSWTMASMLTHLWPPSICLVYSQGFQSVFSGPGPAPEEFHTHTCMCSIDITYEKFDTPHENSYLSTLSCSRRLLDSMHCRELSCLCVSGFSNLFQFITPAFGPNGWKDVGVHCPDFFSLFILLTPWDLH